MSDRGSLSNADTRVRVLSNDELRALIPDQAHGRLGPYLLLRRLGVGGMAEVFLARLEREGSPLVVVKRMLPHLAQDPRYIEMFRREARVALRLDHPNIVRVHGLVEDQGQIGIVMEYLEGLTLFDLAVRSWDAGRSLPLEPLVKMIADAARALDFAHHLPSDGAGGTSTIVHRDVSPDNLLVTKQGITKLLDFGVAKPDDDAALTRTGQVKGKVSFMSPEQARGEKLDGRSDLFSLGVTFYWLITGVRPFDRDNPVATMEAVAFADVPRPSELNEQIPGSLEVILMRLLARDRRFRTPTGAELAEHLDGLLRRVPPDHMCPARLLENILDVDPSLERPWPLHAAVPSVDWASGERRALRGASAPVPTSSDWAAIETLQLPVFGLRELLEEENAALEGDAPDTLAQVDPAFARETRLERHARDLVEKRLGQRPLSSDDGNTSDTIAPDSGPHSSVFTNASLEAFANSAPTVLSASPAAADTIRMVAAPSPVALPADDAPTLHPPTLRSSYPSEIDTAPEGVPLTPEEGAITQPLQPGAHVFPELPLPPASDADTIPEMQAPPVDVASDPAPRAISLPTFPPAKRPPRSSRSRSSLSVALVALALALVSLLSSAALAWFFLMRTDGAPQQAEASSTTDENESAAASSELGSASSPGVKGARAEAPDAPPDLVPLANATKPVDAPGVEAAVEEPAREASPRVEAAAAATQGKAPAKGARPAQSKKKATQKKSAPPPRADERTVALRAPAHITWTLGRRSLGRGSRDVNLPNETASVQAYDTRRQVSVLVPIESDVADFAALPREELVVRVRPWAEVTLGNESLGVTPLEPVPVVPGRYKLRLKWEDTVKELVVKVSKGAGQVVVNVDMREGAPAE